MNISDISKVERKGSNLCVLFTRRNKDNHFDECSIKYSQAPHPDLKEPGKTSLMSWSQWYLNGSRCHLGWTKSPGR